jgi:tetratricopeptide (TPR) repeat protein
MLVYPQDPPKRTTFPAQRINYEEKKAESDYTLSYDDMLHLLDEIESGELEKKCTPEELERIKHFVAFLAKEGALPDNSEESLSLCDDIEELLNGEDNFYENAVSFVTPGEYQYMIVPAILNRHGEVILCKSWVQKQWKHVKKFAKKHKKALIIGAAVVVATAVIVVAVVSAAPAAAAASAAGAVGAAASSDSDKLEKNEQKENSSSTPSVPADIPPGMSATHEAPTLKSTIDERISSFKENILQNQFFQTTNQATEQQGLSWEENARALGSLFAHDSFNNLQYQIPYHSRLAKEIQDINSKYTFHIPGGTNDASIGHPEIDRKFSTDYTHLYVNPGQEIDFNTLSYQVRGEKALAFGYYNQAVQDLGKAIEANPTNPIPYLERGVAHFGLGDYDRSLEDYKQFTSQTQQTSTLSVTEFSLGFAKGLPNGIYESGEGLFLFLGDFATHPIRTARQMADAITTLADLVHKDEWGIVAQALSPEMHQLVTQWDSLPSDKRGELAGYAAGKHGADILVPGALAKIASKSVKSAQELAAICKNLQIAQDTLILETAAGIGNSAKIAEVVETSQKISFFAEELGFTAQEIGQLKQAGKLETAIAKQYDHLSLSMKESIALHKKAQDALKSYAKKPMPELKVRELIHETGIPTFSRPKGIPEDFLVMVADKGAGMEYVHPTNTHIRIRVMPGKAHSPNPCQQKPYVIQKMDGGALDKAGKRISPDAPEAHIPVEEFVYRSHINGN